jgi:hypothetical protein
LITWKTSPDREDIDDDRERIQTLPRSSSENELLSQYKRGTAAENPLRPSSFAVEVPLHGFEVVVLPSAIAIARVPVGHVCVMHRYLGAARDRLQQYLDPRVRFAEFEFVRPPRLDDAAAGLQRDISPHDEAVPHLEANAFPRRDLRLLAACDLPVTLAAEPGVVDLLRTCRDYVEYREVEWHSATSFSGTTSAGVSAEMPVVGNSTSPVRTIL